MANYRLGSGETIRLGCELRSGAEGRITDVVGHPSLVAKIFHTEFTGVTSKEELRRKQERLERKRKKVPVMVQHKPAGWRDRQGHIVLAWPEEVVLERNTVVGFVMPKIDLSDALELNEVSNASDRPRWSRFITFRHLANIALNLAAAVEVTHRGGAVIGDFNERNILVGPTTLVTFVDCDSMQVRYGRDVHLCELGRPEFTAPELLDTGDVIRMPSSDLFALAVHIYTLLYDGAHPFQGGKWTGYGERPSPKARIRKGYYSGGPHSPVEPMAGVVGMKLLPPDILKLFERAFNASKNKPELRPTATEWRTALLRMIKTL